MTQQPFFVVGIVAAVVSVGVLSPEEQGGDVDGQRLRTREREYT